MEKLPPAPRTAAANPHNLVAPSLDSSCFSKSALGACLLCRMEAAVGRTVEAHKLYPLNIWGDFALNQLTDYKYIWQYLKFPPAMDDNLI